MARRHFPDYFRGYEVPVNIEALVYDGVTRDLSNPDYWDGFAVFGLRRVGRRLTPPHHPVLLELLIYVRSPWLNADEQPALAVEFEAPRWATYGRTDTQSDRFPLYAGDDAAMAVRVYETAKVLLRPTLPATLAPEHVLAPATRQALGPAAQVPLDWAEAHGVRVAAMRAAPFTLVRLAATSRDVPPEHLATGPHAYAVGDVYRRTSKPETAGDARRVLLVERDAP